MVKYITCEAITGGYVIEYQYGSQTISKVFKTFKEAPEFVRQLLDYANAK
jgi:uncharacterized protein YfcZ (UPF0381/DUF406 family)